MNEKEQLLQKIENVEKVIPEDIVSNLPGQNFFPEIPEWHSFEHSVWRTGEQVREIFKKNPRLKKDPEIQEKILNLCLCNQAKRGRQSFILLLGSPIFSKYSDEVSSLLKNEDVCGHAINTLIKMKAGNYIDQIEPLTSHNITWIRNEAKKYVQKYKSL